MKFNELSHNSPFVKKFSSEGNYYVYDVNTNQLLKTNKIMDLLINHINDPIEKILNKYAEFYNPETIKKTLKILLDLKRNKKLFSSYRPSSFEIPKSFLEKRIVPMKYIRLELTNNCNLDCTYCYFSGSYPKYTSKGNKFMKFETAKKAIDLLYDNSDKQQNKITISFYGGEPLLSFALIKEVVDYAKDRLKEKEIEFGIVTNGTLLNKEIMGFFVKENFCVVISIDGPKNIHDKGRRYSDGSPTFPVVYKNLKILQGKYKSYFKEKIDFRCTFDLGNDIFQVTSFFEDNFQIDAKNFTLIPIEPKRENLVHYYWKLWEIAENKFEHIPLKYLPRNILEPLIKLVNLKPSILGEKIPLNSTCYPGSSWPIVKVDGIISICDNAGKSDELVIGSVNNGFDFYKIEKIVKNYIHISSEDCFNCWLCRICPMCYISTLNEKGEFDKNTKKEKCDRIRTFYEKIFKLFVKLKKEREDEIISLLS